jgi:hypothetical protein
VAPPEQKVACQQRLSVATQRRGRVQRQQHRRKGQQQRGQQRSPPDAREAHGHAIGSDQEQGKEGHLNQSNCQYTLTEQPEGPGNQVGVKTAHVSLTVEKPRSLPLQNVTRHQRHHRLVGVEGD